MTEKEYQYYIKLQKKIEKIREKNETNKIEKINQQLKETKGHKKCKSN